MVQHYFLAWRDGGVLERINFGAAAAGARSGRARAEPLGWRFDSQSVKDHRSRRAARSRCGEKIKSCKRKLVTDTTGLLVGADVHRADIQDRDGGPSSLSRYTTSFRGCATSSPPAPMPARDCAVR
jgi:hypothetical protein